MYESLQHAISIQKNTNRGLEGILCPEVVQSSIIKVQVFSVSGAVNIKFEN